MAIAHEFSELRTPAQARAALVAVVQTYYRAVREDAALRQLWAGTLADPVLAELSVADNLRNGRLIAERLGPFSPVEPATLELRCILLANLAGAAVSLAVDVGTEDGDRLMAEFEELLDVVLPRG